MIEKRNKNNSFNYEFSPESDKIKFINKSTLCKSNLIHKLTPFLKYKKNKTRKMNSEFFKNKQPFFLLFNDNKSKYLIHSNSVDKINNNSLNKNKSFSQSYNSSFYKLNFNFKVISPKMKNNNNIHIKKKTLYVQNHSKLKNH
jgi:hypothetical protein